MHLRSIIAAALTLVSVVFAQAGPSIPATMVMPVPGTPLSVESMEEYVIKNPDATSTSGSRTTKFFRDAEGRMRIEMEIPQAFGDPILMVQLADPVDGFLTVLETRAKVAHRLRTAKDGARGGIALSLGRNGLIGFTGKTTRKTEDLGKQMIDGIEFQGVRTTMTSDEQPSLMAIDDRWASKERGLIGLLKHTGPDGESTARIQHADRTAPDPALFAIPDDYRIRDLAP